MPLVRSQGVDWGETTNRSIRGLGRALAHSTGHFSGYAKNGPNMEFSKKIGQQPRRPQEFKEDQFFIV